MRTETTDRPLLFDATVIAGSEQGLSRAQYALDQADLLAERSQHIASLNWFNVSKNYEAGYAAIYLQIETTSDDKDRFPFLVLNKEVVIGGIGADEISDRHSGDRRADAKGVGANGGASRDQPFPVLIHVGDFVDGPKGVISSGVWSLGFNERPLISREFLFYSLLDPFPWEFARLPVVEAAEWEPYARHTSPGFLDPSDHHLVEGTSKVADGFDQLPCNVIGGVFDAACDYARSVRIVLGEDMIGCRLVVPVDERYKVAKFALSSFDLFL